MALGTYGHEVDAHTRAALARAWFDPEVCSFVLVVQGLGRTKASRRAPVDNVTYLIPVARGRNERQHRLEGLSYKVEAHKQSSVPYMALIRVGKPNWFGSAVAGTYLSGHLEVDNAYDPRRLYVYTIPTGTVVEWLCGTDADVRHTNGKSYVGVAGILRSYRTDIDTRKGRGWVCDIILSTRVTEPLRAYVSTKENPWVVAVDIEEKYINGAYYTVHRADTQRAASMDFLGNTSAPETHWIYDEEAYAAKWGELVRGGLLATQP